MAKNSLALPDNVFGLLAAADQQHGFTPGTMQALLMQETGGQTKYLTDPTTHHYPVNAEGKRIAPQSGKVSTAFGPLGILESTAADPGYGVKPMGDKTDLGEHIRFSADYLAARGLAAYGEGSGYAAQVASRLPTQPILAATAVPDRVTAVAPVVLAQDTPPTMAPVDTPVVPVGDLPQAAAPYTLADWNKQYLQTPAPVQVADLAYGGPKPYVPAEVQRPDFMAALGMLGQQQQQTPNFHAFSGMRRRA